MKFNRVLITCLIGLVVGLATVFGQKYLPGALNSIANSGSVWIIPAFYIGAKQNNKIHSIGLSILYLLVCVMTYYGYYAILWDLGFSINFHQLIWMICALIFGFVFGLGGYLSQNSNTKIKCFCSVILPATFIAESLTFIIHFKNYQHMVDVIVMWLIVGVALYFINTKKHWSDKSYFGALLVMLILGLIGYQLVYYSDQLVHFFN